MSKVWFITGAGSGMARDRQGGVEGRRPASWQPARNLDKARKALGDVAGDNLALVQLDVTSEAQAKAAVAEAVARFGRIDVAVNNAGYSLLGNFEESTVPEIEAQFATNFYGVVHVMRAVLPVMRKQRSGHIINIGSVRGRRRPQALRRLLRNEVRDRGPCASRWGSRSSRSASRSRPSSPACSAPICWTARTSATSRKRHRGLRRRGSAGSDVVGLSRHAAGRSGQARRGHPQGRRDGKPAEGVRRRKRRDRDDHAGHRRPAERHARPRGTVQIDGRFV